MNNKKFLSDEESNHLETYLRLKLATDPRDCLLLLIAMKTGARASEVLAIRKEDVEVSSQSLFIRGMKGSNDRQIPIDSLIFKKLIKYMDTISSDLIFPITYKRMQQIWYQYRPVKKKLHSLRHTLAIKVYKKAKDIHLVKTILGHSNIQNTLVYLDYVQSQKDMRKALL